MAENDATEAGELEEVEEIVETKDEFDNDTTDYKALALKNLGIAKRLKTKLEKAKLDKKVDAKVEKVLEKEEKKEGFDYAELAYLEVKGISSDDEVKYVENLVKETGKSLKDLLATAWFQAELKEMRDTKASKEAIPTGSKRSTSSSKDSVEYWIAKGEMPENTPENRKLRQDIVNSKIKAKKSGDIFAKQSIIS